MSKTYPFNSFDILEALKDPNFKVNARDSAEILQLLQQRTQRAMRIGAQVEFDHQGQTYKGIVTQINRKSVGVLVQPGGKWRVGPNLLRLVA